MLRRKTIVLMVAAIIAAIPTQTKGDMGIMLDDAYSRSRKSDSVFSSTDAYSLNDVIDYFCSKLGILPGYIIISDELTRLPNIDEVAVHFPIEFMRKSDKYFYSILQIEEGGRFYIFWNIESGNLYPCSVSYINKKRDISEFDLIIPGISTISDVQKLDPLPISDMLRSSGPYMYSILEHGVVLEFRYDGNNGIITEKTQVTSTNSIADYILPQDYPN